jgi:phosphomevalonate kinase
MSAVVVASAPGKLVLTGEYAVLENAPAVSAAVDLRATVEVQAADTEYSELNVVNNDQRYRFRAGAVKDWLDDSGPYGAIVDAAMHVLRGRAALSKPLTISICTRDFYLPAEDAAEEPVKKGIGSSAAVAVALTAALQTIAGETPDMELALETHHLFQGAQGSGIDVATSWFGGLIKMLPGQPPPSTPRVQQLAWPEGLYVMPVWTGQAASTPAKLRLLSACKAATPEAYNRVFESLCLAAATAATAWSNGRSREIFAAIKQFAGALHELDTAATLGIWSEPHRKLNELAGSGDVVYKPSGAGGGDFGVAFATDEVQLSGFGERAVEQGFGINTVAWSSEGLRVSRR